MSVVLIHLVQDAAYPKPELVGIYKTHAESTAKVVELTSPATKYSEARASHLHDRTSIARDFLFRNKHALRVPYGSDDDDVKRFVDGCCEEVGGLLEHKASTWCDPLGEISRFIVLSAVSEPLPSFNEPKWDDFSDRPPMYGSDFWHLHHSED